MANTQDMGGAEMINVADPINAQDVMNLETASATAAAIPRVYWENTQMTGVWEYYNNVVVASGVVTFNLTKDGTPTGTALFPNNVFKESINLTLFDASNSYVYSVPTIGTGNKTITFTVNKVALSLGLLNFTSAANGATVYLSLKGN